MGKVTHDRGEPGEPQLAQIRRIVESTGERPKRELLQEEPLLPLPPHCKAQLNDSTMQWLSWQDAKSGIDLGGSSSVLHLTERRKISAMILAVINNEELGVYAAAECFYKSSGGEDFVTFENVLDLRFLRRVESVKIDSFVLLNSSRQIPFFVLANKKRIRQL